MEMFFHFPYLIQYSHLILVTHAHILQGGLPSGWRLYRVRPAARTDALQGSTVLGVNTTGARATTAVADNDCLRLRVKTNSHAPGVREARMHSWSRRGFGRYFRTLVCLELGTSRTMFL